MCLCVGVQALVPSKVRGGVPIDLTFLGGHAADFIRFSQSGFNDQDFMFTFEGLCPPNPQLPDLQVTELSDAQPNSGKTKLAHLTFPSVGRYQICHTAAGTMREKDGELNFTRVREGASSLVLR